MSPRMEDSTRLPPGLPPGLPENIETCLEQAGGSGFIAPFLDLAQAAGADQLMIFAYAGSGATCLLSRNFDEAPLGARLASAYLDGGFAQDPLHPRVQTLRPGPAELHRLADHLDAMPPAYRARFFDRPGIRDKTAVLVAGWRLRIAVNFYWRGDAPVADAMARLLARLALLHFEADPEPGLPAPLSALSGRERAVCLGILAGRKAEAIAHDLGVTPHSVVTYRRRAYAKLGIHSRAALFALCRPASVQSIAGTT